MKKNLRIYRANNSCIAYCGNGVAKIEVSNWEDYFSLELHQKYLKQKQFILARTEMSKHQCILEMWSPIDFFMDCYEDS